MSTSVRRYEILVPRRFNDRQPVPDKFIGETVSEQREQFGAVSSQTQTIQGERGHNGKLGHMSMAFLQLLLWTCLTSACGLHAHKDRIIELNGTTLVGLPKSYAPAELDMKAFRLRIGNHAMTFSPFLKSLFDEPHDLRIAASWYHERSTLPPYISLHIQPKKKDFSYSILINLDTLDLIQLSVILQESDSATRHLRVALSDEQKEEIRKSIETLKK